MANLVVDRVTVQNKTYSIAFDPTYVMPIASGGTGATTAAQARSNLGLGNVATENILPASKGGTGLTSLQAVRNSMGLGNTTGALPIANGGTGATTALAARENLGVVQTSFLQFSGNAITVINNYEYYNPTAIARLTINLPTAQPGAIFGVNFTSANPFNGVTFSDTVAVVGDTPTVPDKRYNLIVWYDGSYWWCASRSK